MTVTTNSKPSPGRTLSFFLKNCDACGSIEERVFTDSWSGATLCCTCLYKDVGHLTNSPADEGDNIADVWPDLDVEFSDTHNNEGAA